MEFLKTQGRLTYDPIRRDLKKVWKQRTLTVELPWDDLDLYYQWFLRRKYGTWFDHEQKVQEVFARDRKTLLWVWGSITQINSNVPRVNRPMWGKHVTVVRGDEQGYKSPNWGKHEGEMIDIFYAPELEQTWKFWSIPVKGDNLFEFRRELGLNAFHDFHITVAREM